MTTRAFDDPTGNGDTFGQRLLILEVRRVVEEIVRTVSMGCRSTAVMALRVALRRMPAGTRLAFPRSISSRCARTQQSCSGGLSVRRVNEDILGHMNKGHDDGDGNLTRLRKLLEMVDLREIAIDDSDPPFLSPRIAVRPLVEHRRDHSLR
jgi:hypothetical protein